MSYDLNISTGKGTKEEQLRRLKEAMTSFDAIMIGAGAGLSTSAGLTYSGERFRKYFFDFAEKYGIRDIYSGGFYPFPDEETRWAWWARHAYFNRYITAPKPVYPLLLSLVKDKDYFVLTTNVDHQFQLAGFEALFACLNYGEAYCPRQIEDQAICIDDDIGETLRAIRVNPYEP